MGVCVGGNRSLLSRLKALAKLQIFFRKFSHTLVERGLQPQLKPDMAIKALEEQVHIGSSKWKKLDSRTFGITRSMISEPSWIVLKILQAEGFDAYLVGGCVRDLLLNKIPKDFDVITTANLKQIRKQFHCAQIVGRRFPICRVRVKGSVVEVSSFETVAGNPKEKEKNNLVQIPRSCGEKDFVRWRNSMHRDFTVNSLFFDPFVNKIYDYANGMNDLRSLRLQTLVPAQLSFKQDCARILRGLRIAARLGLSFSKDIEIAIRNLYSSITSLDKSRIMMELNYMLSYGAAEPSLHLLQSYNLLDILLPFHAAYLDQQSSNLSAQGSKMLMKLLSCLDKLVSCDRPSDCSLWVGLLVFHLALVNNPQDILVVWTFSSVLYYGDWEGGVKFAREHAEAHVNFMPEVLHTHASKSDAELAKEVTQFASLVQNSVNAFTEAESLYELMSRCAFHPCHGLVFIPKRTGKDVIQIFEVLVNDIEYYQEGRESFNTRYDLLGKGNLKEIRFALGKVIMDTMSSGGRDDVGQEPKDHPVVEHSCSLALLDMDKEDKECSLSSCNAEFKKNSDMKRKLVEKKHKITELENARKKRKTAADEDLSVKEKQEVIENEKSQTSVKEHQKAVNEKSTVAMSKLLKAAVSMPTEDVRGIKKCHLEQQEISEKKPKDMCPEAEKAVDEGKCAILWDKVTKKKQMVSRKFKLTQKVIFKNQSNELEKSRKEPTKKRQEVSQKCKITQDGIFKNPNNELEKNRKEPVEDIRSLVMLSSLFR